jgi:hypothetical protein
MAAVTWLKVLEVIAPQQCASAAQPYRRCFANTYDINCSDHHINGYDAKAAVDQIAPA